MAPPLTLGHLQDRQGIWRQTQVGHGHPHRGMWEKEVSQKSGLGVPRTGRGRGHSWMALVPPGGPADLGIALCNPAATNPTWLFRAKLSDIKIKYPSCMSHTACARRPPRIGGYHVGQHRYRTFPWAQRVLTQNSALLCYCEALRGPGWSLDLSVPQFPL